MPLPYITIIILHYKNLSDTQKCLKSLQKLDYEPFSVIVVNNDSPEHKTLLKENFGDFADIIQNNENLGFAEGNNVGIRQALADSRTDAVLLLNNDTEVEPNFLKEMVSLGDDMVAPRMLQYYNRDKIDNLGIVMMSSGLPFNRSRENQKLFCPTGGCALYSRKLLESVAYQRVIPNTHAAIRTSSANQNKGSSESTTKFFTNNQNDVNYFDPTYFAYAEDLDLGWRALSAGFEAAYAKNAIVYHKGSEVYGKLSDFAVYHTFRNLVWTQIKNFPLPLLLWQSPWLFAGWISIFFYYLIKARPGIIIKAWIDAIQGLPIMAKRRKQIQKNKKILRKFETGLYPKKLNSQN